MQVEARVCSSIIRLSEVLIVCWLRLCGCRDTIIGCRECVYSVVVCEDIRLKSVPWQGMRKLKSNFSVPSQVLLVSIMIHGLGVDSVGMSVGAR